MHNELKPEFLAPGGMRTPTVWSLLLVFIREYRLKRSAVQVQSHHIRRVERAWWQGRVKQLVDVLAPRGADLHRRICRRTGSDDDPRARFGWGKSEIREVKEGAGLVPVSGWVVC